MSQEIDIRNADFGTIAVRTTVAFTKRYPKITVGYLVGLAVVLFGVGFAVDEATKGVYSQQMQEVGDFEYRKMDDVFRKKQGAYDAYYNSKGWFSCDYTCQNNYQRYLKYEQEYNVVADERDRLLTKAKKTVGIFSEYGVADARAYFWAAWERGKEIAKRYSWFDAMWTPMTRQRDEEGVVTLLRFIGKVMMNFTVGLSSSVVSFLWNLIWFVRSYEAGPAGVLFFILAACGALAVLASFLLGMFVVVGGGTVMAIKYSDRAALQNGGRGRQRRLNQNRRHQHWQ